MKRLLTTALLFLSISTTATAAITGSIVDDDGAPLAGANIRLFAAESPRETAARLRAGTLERTPIARATTTENGTFKLETGGATLAVLVVSAPGREWVEREVPDGDDAGVVLLGTSKSRKLRVVADGKPVAGAVVYAGSAFAVKSGADGVVEMPAMSGTSIRTNVLHPDFAPFATFLTPQTSDLKLSPGVTVTGRVLGPDGRTPAAGAKIVIGNASTAVAGADGKFTLTHAPQDWRAIVATGNAGSAIASNIKAASYELRLRPSASFSGSIRDSKSRAGVAGMRLTLINRSDVSIADTVVSDAKGNFVLDGLTAAQYVVSASHPGYALDTRLPLDLAPGDKQTRAMNATPYARVRGTVTDSEKKAVGGAVISRGIGAAFENTSRFGVTNARGEFAFRAPATAMEMDVQAMKAGYASAIAKAKFNAGETTSVAITMPRGFPLVIRVLDHDKKPVPDASVILMLWRDDPQSSRIPIARCLGIVGCVTTEEGTVETRLAPGKYDVTVGGESIVLKSLSGQLIDAKTSPLTITVERGVELSGRVMTADNQPVADAMVTLIPSGDAARSTTSDASGAFAFKNAPRGAGVIQAALTRGSRLSSPKKDVTAPANDIVITMPRGGTLTGRVIDDAHSPVTDFQVMTTHAGMPGASLSFQRDDGTFTLNELPPGRIDVQVTARGFVTGWARGVEVEEGKASAAVEVLLTRGATIKGRVTSSDGQPIEGATVFANESGNRGFGGNQNNRGVTEASGEYSLSGVAPGSRSLYFSKQGFIAAEKSVEVAGGKDARLDVVLERGRELQGRVIDESGSGVDQAEVTIEGAGFGAAPARSDSDGQFKISGLREGRFRVSARKNGYVKASVEDAEAGAAAITLTLRRGATVTGRVTGATDAELSLVMVSVVGQGTMANARAESTGNFSVQGIPDGRFLVEATVTGPQPRRTPRKSVEVVNGSAPSVDLTFGEGYSLRGRVTAHGQPVGGAMISFAPSDTAAGASASGRIDSDGSYLVSGLALGEYRVSVMSPMIGPLGSDTTTVTGNGTFDLDLRVGTVRGRVLDARTGAPLADALISYQSRDNTFRGLPPHSVSTDSLGRFSSDFVPEKSWRLRVQREKYETAFADIVVGPGTPDVEVKLSPAAGIVARVVDSRDGTPVVGAMVSATDSTGRPIFSAQTKEDGVAQLWLAPGHYTLRANAQLFAGTTVQADVPGANVQISLDRGGRIIVASPDAARLRLSGPNLGAPIMSFNGRFENVRPGTYKLELMSNENKPIGEKSISVIGGQTTTITF